MITILRVLILVLGLSVVHAAAATYYIDDTGGDDARSCATAQTIGTPKLTPASAIACLTVAGDILYIRAGTYTGRIEGSVFPVSGTSGSPILVSGYTGETVTFTTNEAIKFYNSGRTYIEIQDIVIDGSGYTTHSTEYNGAIIWDSYITLRRVEIKDTWMNGLLTIGDSPASTGNRYLDLIVHGCGRVPIATYSPGGNGVYSSDDSALFQGGSYYNNAQYAIRIVDSSAEPQRATGNVINRARIYQNGYGKGLDGKSVRTGGAVVVGDTDNTVQNSLIYDNQYGVDVSGLSSKVTQQIKVYNNTIYSNTTGILVGSNAGANDTELKNDIIYGNTTNLTLGTQTNTTYATNLCNAIGTGCALSGDPTFTDAAAGNFTITASSTAYNTCTTLPSVTADFISTARPQASIYDCGAYDVIVAARPTGGPSRLRCVGCSH